MSGPEFAECAECPSCGDRAQPEQDGDLVYWACGCGQEFGYRRVVQSQEGTCAAGIDLSHLATLNGVAPAEASRLLGPMPDASGVFLGSVIPLRPEEN